jgi:hypothetical protein
MLKATTVNAKGRRELLLGLTFANLDRLRMYPGDDYIKIDGAALGLPMDVLIFSGRNEAHCAEIIAPGVDARTKVEIDPKLKQ